MGNHQFIPFQNDYTTIVPNISFYSTQESELTKYKYANCDHFKKVGTFIQRQKYPFKSLIKFQ